MVALLTAFGWFVHYTGSDENRYWYGWWSGFGGFTTIAVSGLLIAFAHLRKHNCHVKGCWRFGRHSVDGTPYVTCRRHHPELDESEACTVDVVQAAYDEGRRAR